MNEERLKEILDNLQDKWHGSERKYHIREIDINEHNKELDKNLDQAFTQILKLGRLDRKKLCKIITQHFDFRENYKLSRNDKDVVAAIITGDCYENEG